MDLKKYKHESGSDKNTQIRPDPQTWREYPYTEASEQLAQQQEKSFFSGR